MLSTFPPKSVDGINNLMINYTKNFSYYVLCLPTFTYDAHADISDFDPNIPKNRLKSNIYLPIIDEICSSNQVGKL